ncbi:MAG: type I DNA topoisomerase, partial [Acidimicrobiales bacterium]|nr:type I DNA topoisomerase [Acidimicrobiales bacterium]
MPTRLVIVESPAKARTIAGYLGDDYVVESSVGHVRDLPQRAADVPEAFKGEAWARLGVDVDNDFKPLYVVSPGKKDVVRDLKRALKDADELFLATDEDREGEAIAWHLLELLSPRVPVRRMVFHEITPEAIQRAIDEPRDLDRRLVDAQETRRILDRLYGYEVSPVLWKMIRQGLSAGRVQSVATRLVVQRERERMAFTAAGYWDIEGTFSPEGALGTFDATLVQVDGARVATGKDFDDTGAVKTQGVRVLDEAGATGLVDDLGGASFAVRSVESKPYTSRPKAPFTTSTLQQESGRKLRFSSSRTMAIAQRLYENGHITYMRTDSTTLSDAALNAARSQILERYGREYVPDAPRTYTKKVKNAQEAHEAIRPAGDSFRTPDQLRSELDNDSFRLYELIWARTVASQMTDARGETVSVRLGATSATGTDAEFAASGRTITFPGYLRAYQEGRDDAEAGGDREDQERILPPLSEGGRLTAERLEPKGHETKPPARYTEASLVAKLEEIGVGRPSTYAATIGTIIDREYVWKKGSALVPSFTAFAVINLLETHFPDLVDYDFTARMEDDLDHIAGGEAEAIPWLNRFYFGNGHAGLKDMVTDLGVIDPRAVSSVPIGVDDEGRALVARAGKYGAYVARVPAPGAVGDDGQPAKEQTVSLPDDIVPDELTVERAIELLDAPAGDREVGVDPDTGLTVLAKNGRFGPYVQLGELVDGGEKPKTASLFKDMSVDTIDLDEALKLLSLPRVVGADPADGVEITVQNGRYGPYLKKGSDSRSLADERLLFTIGLDECLRILAEPKRRRGQAAPAAPLRELGTDPSTDLPVVVKDGRFGPYVTDGESNASLRKGDTV